MACYREFRSIGKYCCSLFHGTVAHSHCRRLVEGFSAAVFFAIAHHVIWSLSRNEDASGDVALLETVVSSFQASSHRFDGGAYSHKVTKLFQLFLTSIYALESHSRISSTTLLDSSLPTSTGFTDTLDQSTYSLTRKKSTQPQSDLHNGLTMSTQSRRCKPLFPDKMVTTDPPAIHARNSFQPNQYMQRHRGSIEDNTRTNTFNDEINRNWLTDGRERSQSAILDPLLTDMNINGPLEMQCGLRESVLSRRATYRKHPLTRSASVPESGNRASGTMSCDSSRIRRTAGSLGSKTSIYEPGKY